MTIVCCGVILSLPTGVWSNMDFPGIMYIAIPLVRKSRVNLATKISVLVCIIANSFSNKDNIKV